MLRIFSAKCSMLPAPVKVTSTPLVCLQKRYAASTIQRSNVKIKDNHFEFAESSPFSIFHNIAKEYLDSIHADPDKYVTNILSIWSIVHGISVLIVEKSITFDGDYLDDVSKML